MYLHVRTYKKQSYLHAHRSTNLRYDVGLWCWCWLSWHEYPVVVMAASAVLLQLLLQFRQPLSNKVNVLWKGVGIHEGVGLCNIKVYDDALSAKWFREHTCDNWPAEWPSAPLWRPPPVHGLPPLLGPVQMKCSYIHTCTYCRPTYIQSTIMLLQNNKFCSLNLYSTSCTGLPYTYIRIYVLLCTYHDCRYVCICIGRPVPVTHCESFHYPGWIQVSFPRPPHL